MKYLTDEAAAVAWLKAGLVAADARRSALQDSEPAHLHGPEPDALVRNWTGSAETAAATNTSGPGHDATPNPSRQKVGHR